MSFQQFSLDSRLLRGVAASGYATPTEIQRQAIPIAMQGRDLMASAQTGTGKTAVFALVALQRLVAPAVVRSRGPRVLVLAPTRELAMQVSETVRELGRFVRPVTGVIVGGVAYAPQEKLLRRPVDVLVATPGRLIDHMGQGRIDFSRIELLVLDEADRMLDMGFIKDVERIVAAAPKNRQTMLFSATLDSAIYGIAGRFLREPAAVELAHAREKHADIEQRVHCADGLGHKRALLNRLLDDDKVAQALVFTATKRSAEQVAATVCAQGHACAALHGDMRQGARNRTMDRMRRGGLRVLVATDVAARGLDIRTISHVINFDLPMTAEDYVHRIGRTGRCGEAGIAISLVSPQDGGKLASIERYTGQRLERQVIPGLEPTLPEPRNTAGRQDVRRGRVFKTEVTHKKRKPSNAWAGRSDGAAGGSTFGRYRQRPAEKEGFERAARPIGKHPKTPSRSGKRRDAFRERFV